MRNTFKAAITAPLIGLALAAVIAVGAPAQSAGYLAGEEAHVLDMVNETRASKGLGTLKMRSELVKMARNQADKMAAAKDIFHNDNLGGDATAAGLEWLRIGENVGMGPNVDVIEEAFLKSPHHYENIVYKTYDHAGIGVVDGGDGKRYVVQVFADLAGTSSTSSASEPAAEPKKSVTHEATPKPAPASAAPASAAPATPVPTPEPVSSDPNALLEGIVAAL
jgi:uncharacterized protein YkwD